MPQLLDYSLISNKTIELGLLEYSARLSPPCSRCQQKQVWSCDSADHVHELSWGRRLGELDRSKPAWRHTAPTSQGGLLTDQGIVQRLKILEGWLFLGYGHLRDLPTGRKITETWFNYSRKTRNFV